MISKTKYIKDTKGLVGKLPTIKFYDPKYIYLATANARCPKADIFVNVGDHVNTYQVIGIRHGAFFDQPIHSSVSGTYVGLEKHYHRNGKLTDFIKIENDFKNIKKKDHPLSTNPSSNCCKYFEDQDLKDTIDKDIKRTKTHMHFFLIPSQNQNSKYKEKDGETNADVMARILFIYGKNHPEVGYVQGMNEIIAPIYYSYSFDNTLEFHQHVQYQDYILIDIQLRL